ncbi:MAG: NTP transferase domain-containing protein [Desulfobacterales bacterium]|jgi:UDP-N-acetylglucosamine diphosphorylase/glucosamine-1-phosphate N-acetyltransferase
MKSNTAVIILAAGLGTRMKSNKAKVLHEIQGRPMVSYVVETARQVAGNNVIVVVGNQAEKVRQVVSENEDLLFAYQEKQLGTAHAVLCAVPQIPEPCTEVVILCGDVPLIRPETVSRLIDDHLEAQRDISLLAVELENPFGYGRILLDSNDQLSGIVEEADATSKQKRIKMINSGIYCVNKEFLVRALPQVRSNNAQGELYLTDIIEIGYIAKTTMGVMVGADEREILGVNNLKDLQQVDAIMKTRMRIIS